MITDDDQSCLVLFRIWVSSLFCTKNDSCLEEFLIPGKKEKYPEIQEDFINTDKTLADFGLNYK